MKLFIIIFTVINVNILFIVACEQEKRSDKFEDRGERLEELNKKLLNESN